MPSFLHIPDKRSYAWFSLICVVVLLVVIQSISPVFLAPRHWPILLAGAAPFMIAAMAQAIPVLSGNGGIDLSVGPLMGLVNAVVVTVLGPAGITDPLPGIAICLAIGILSGLLNGLLVTVVRLQAVVATLGTYLAYQGLALAILPTPSGFAPTWVSALAGSLGGVPGALIPLGAVGLLWLACERSAYRRNLLAVGGDEKAAYTAGVSVTGVRMLAYVIAGIFAVLAGLAVTGLLGSGDPRLGPSYTLTSLASVALGGIALSGGRGGLLGAAAGGMILYLLQSLLTLAHVSILYLQIVYGVILLGAVALNVATERLAGRR